MKKIEELKKLKGLLEIGLVNQEEFNTLKAEILGITTPKQQEVDSKEIIESNKPKVEQKKEPVSKPGNVSLKKDKPDASRNQEIVYESQKKPIDQVQKDENTDVKAIKPKCKKCSKEISKYLDDSNKGLCIDCKEKNLSIPKWAYLFLLLIIPLGWWIFKDTPQEEAPIKQTENTVVKESKIEKESSNTNDINNESDLPKFGYIKGTDIIIRQAPNSSSKILGSFKYSGERVSVLDPFIDNNKQVLLKKDYETQTGEIIKKGKALTVKAKGSDDIYIVYYEDSNSDNLFSLKISSDYLDFTNNIWYKVKRTSGEVGWVFGKFVSFDKLEVDKSNILVNSHAQSSEILEYYLSVGYLESTGDGVNKPSYKPVVDNSNWHYVAVTKDYLDGKIYLDGKLITSSTFADKPYIWHSLLLGATQSCVSCSPVPNYNGLIDEMRISNVIRTAKEIENQYVNNTPFDNDPNTIGLFHFDVSNGYIMDNAVSTNNGSLYGNIKYTQGKYGLAISLNGINDYANIKESIPVNNMTLEFWFKSADNNGTIVLLEYAYNLGINIKSFDN